MSVTHIYIVVTLTDSVIFGVLANFQVNSRALYNLFFLSAVNWLSELHCILVSSSKIVRRNDWSVDSSKNNELDKYKSLKLTCSTSSISGYDLDYTMR